MFSWRLKIREARQAFKTGRTEDAVRILQQESIRDFLPAKRLSREVAQHLVGRAEQQLQQGDSIASWSDLQQAARLGGCDGRVAELRRAQTERGIERARNFLLQGETKLAADQIARLESHHLGGAQRRTWKLIVQLIARGKEMSRQGETTSALEMLERATGLLPNTEDELATMLHTRQADLKRHAIDLTRLTNQLHSALTQKAWTEVLDTAESMLELAPAHSAARRARRRAWDAVGMGATRVLPQKDRQRLVRSVKSTHAWTSSAKVDTWAMNQEQGKRFVAWIDGVGGYLICLGNELVLGQPTGGGADIPILADLSRRHATIRREGESYVLTPIHKVRVDAQELTGPQVLKDNSLIELGDAVRMRFRKPHALSGTAVVTIESHHKTEPAVDSIVLMSESCVLGSQSQSHIHCRKWTDDIVLFRRGEDLQFRTSASVKLNSEVDGEAASSGGLVTHGTRIEGENFSLSVEEIANS